MTKLRFTRNRVFRLLQSGVEALLAKVFEKLQKVPPMAESSGWLLMCLAISHISVAMQTTRPQHHSAAGQLVAPWSREV